LSDSAGLRVDWLDVFTDRPFAGNPLAVVPDADGLGDEQLQTIAAELGVSETVFVFDGNVRLRIFTPKREMPLAGHPVVGVTLDLVRLGRIAANGVHVFATQAGDTPVEVAGGVATMRQGAFDPGTELEPATVAPLVGLEPGDVVGTPRICSTTSLQQAFVHVADRDALRGLQPDFAALAAWAPAFGVAAWCEHSGEVAQRFFAPQAGIPEDPATGSAAGALGALRVFEGAEPGEVVVRQGEEIGRPSTMRVRVGGTPGAPGDVLVGGTAVLVLEARLGAVP
jgi:trans-2,3-dihydro-3-hydroxyanthranilate isomerase